MTSETPPDLDAVEQDLRGLMRAAAEARVEAAEAEQRGRADKRRVLLAITDVLDGFDRVLRSIANKPEHVTPQVKIWLGNFRSVRRLLETVLVNEGATHMTHADPVFNPHFHTIAEIRTGSTQPDGTIVEEAEPGYMWGAEVLRKAKVVVVREAEEP